MDTTLFQTCGNHGALARRAAVLLALFAGTTIALAGPDRNDKQDKAPQAAPMRRSAPAPTTTPSSDARSKRLAPTPAQARPQEPAPAKATAPSMPATTAATPPAQPPAPTFTSMRDRRLSPAPAAQPSQPPKMSIPTGGSAVAGPQGTPATQTPASMRERRLSPAPQPTQPSKIAIPSSGAELVGPKANATTPAMRESAPRAESPLERAAQGARPSSPSDARNARLAPRTPVQEFTQPRTTPLTGDHRDRPEVVSSAPILRHAEGVREDRGRDARRDTGRREFSGRDFNGHDFGGRQDSRSHFEWRDSHREHPVVVIRPEGRRHDDHDRWGGWRPYRRFDPWDSCWSPRYSWPLYRSGWYSPGLSLGISFGWDSGYVSFSTGYRGYVGSCWNDPCWWRPPITSWGSTVYTSPVIVSTPTYVYVDNLDTLPPSGQSSVATFVNPAPASGVDAVSRAVAAASASPTTSLEMSYRAGAAMSGEMAWSATPAGIAQAMLNAGSAAREGVAREYLGRTLPGAWEGTVLETRTLNSGTRGVLCDCATLDSGQHVIAQIIEPGQGQALGVGDRVSFKGRLVEITIGSQDFPGGLLVIDDAVVAR